MKDQDQIILSILKSIFGNPKNSHSESEKEQWEFNCISDTCRPDVNKYNLSYNSKLKIYKCWKCHDKGTVRTLVKKYGEREHLEKLNLILPANALDTFFPTKEEKDLSLITCPLPPGYTFLNSEAKTPMHKLALDYVLNTRKITREQIERFKIGYTEIGPYRNRIIIPSFNQQERINYFDARSFIKGVKPTYYKPDSKAFPGKKIPDKYDIIFNELFINWDLPIYLVEGLFDFFRIPNSIPMLGSSLPDIILKKILKHNCKVVICLDEDAISYAVDIYEKLTFMGIDCYIVEFPPKKDVSKIFENFGNEELAKILRTRKKIDFINKFEKLLKK